MMDFKEDVVDDHGVFKVFKDLMRFMAPVWMAFCIGMVAGWAWKPKLAWTNLIRKGFKSSKTLSSSSQSSILSPLPLSPRKAFGSAPCLYSLNYKTFDVGATRQVCTKDDENEALSMSADSETKDVEMRNMCDVISDEDLEHLYDLVEMQDGGPPWIPMMEKSTSDMSYQAWRRDLESGLPQYCSKTIYENVSAELVRDFFWDDEFRLKWDDMLANASILEECETTGTMVVRWVRKFPFFCSDREYIIARRIWVAPGGTYYCVTKGIPNAPLPRHDKPRRVDVYYSSWRIRPVASRSGYGCEVILFHHEDMGIPWEIAKLGVKQGMWGTVKKIHRGIRAYQKERTSNETTQAQLSRYAFMAAINSKVNLEKLRSSKISENVSEDQMLIPTAHVEKSPGTSLPKFLIFGGAILIACSLDKALLTKAVIFGIGRKFANISRGVRV